jgi:uncharacterized protein YjbJ (UPF0337 family)
MTHKEMSMGFMDKLRNKLQMGRGRVKQQAGRATGDPYLEASGKSERVGGSVKQVGEQVKDAGKNIRDAATPPTR